MAGPESFLPVIRVITDNAGGSITPADELRIKSGLTVTYVPGPGINGPGRIELDVYTAPAADTEPFTLPVAQPPVAAGESGSGGSTRTILAFAGVTMPSTFTGAAFVAGGALLEDPTDFATFSLWECDTTGTHVGSALYTGTTETGGTNATGDWDGGELVVDAGLGLDIAAGHTLAVEWYTNHGAGVDIPGGWWRIT